MVSKIGNEVTHHRLRTGSDTFHQFCLQRLKENYELYYVQESLATLSCLSTVLSSGEQECLNRCSSGMHKNAVKSFS